MVKDTKRRWMWAGALAGALALGTACSATEGPTQLAQATPGTGQTGTASSPVPGASPQDTTVSPGTTTTAPGTSTGTTTTPGTGTGTTAGSGTVTTSPGYTTPPGTTSTGQGTGMGGSGTAGSSPLSGSDGGVGMGGSGLGGSTPGLNPNPSGSSSTFQPPTGGSVIDGGTRF